MNLSSEKYQCLFNEAKELEGISKSRLSKSEKYDNDVEIVFSVKVNEMVRELYVKVGSGIPHIKFPHWKGVKIGYANLLEIEDANCYYFLLSQDSDSSGYIFELIVEDIRVTLSKLSYTKDVIRSLEVTLAKWKKFFLTEKDIVLPIERQQGLFGELFFLKELIDRYGASAVNYWAGCNDETHDFYLFSNGIEVKTTSTQEPYKVMISSEHQLDDKDVSGNLFLKFYALRKSESDGMKIPELVAIIENKLSSFDEQKIKFEELCQRYGYFEVAKELYTYGFSVREETSFRVCEGFPRIINSVLAKGISNTKYTISINMCQKYLISNTELYLSLEEVK